MGNLGKILKVWLARRPAKPITVERLNELRLRAFESFSDFPILRPDVLCTSCKFPVYDEYHIDFSITPARRQVTCSNRLCKRVDYRILGFAPHDTMQLCEEIEIDDSNGST